MEQEAEECFLKAIDVAQQQQAKSLELRAAVSLARLWRQQNKGNEARQLLEEIYDWFTEGFDTKDLQDAAALLNELGGAEERQKVKDKKQKARQAEGLRLKAEGLPPFLPLSLQPAASSLAEHVALSRQSLSSPAPSPQPLAPSLFHCEGEYWTVNFASATCRLKDARGLHYIAHLLQHPHQDIHVITLITVGANLSEGPTDAHPFQDPSLPFDHTEGFGDAGEILGPQARTAYKQRLSELREELAEAQQFHDLGRSKQLAAELDFLTHELTRIVGLDGRTRQVGSPAERARVNITRAIKVALRKIAEHHPGLGQHLATTIKTGAYCSYTPDVRMPITWRS